MRTIAFGLSPAERVVDVLHHLVLPALTLGIDRDSAKLAATFDERNEAVMISIEKVVKGCKAAGVTCSICGQAPSVYPEITEKLVEPGELLSAGTALAVVTDLADAWLTAPAVVFGDANRV